MVRNPGQEVRLGALLYSIYSEELLSDENAFLLTQDQRLNEPSKQIEEDLIKASRKKLQLWGLTHAQIRAVPAESAMAGPGRRAAAQAIMQRLVELRARCQRQTSPDISRYLCMIEQVCARFVRFSADALRCGVG
jgi:hypothetical protein